MLFSTGTASYKDRDVQAVWWVQPHATSVPQLAVLWSSLYYHDTGDLVSSYERDSSFGVATYDFDALCAWVCQTTSGQLNGAVMMAQPRLDGAEAAIVLQTRNGTRGALYRIGDSWPCLLSIVCSESLPRPGVPPSHGPFAVAVCPRGEAVCAAHRAGRHLYLELLVRGDGPSPAFCSVASIDATHCVTAAGTNSTTLYDGDVVPFTVRWSPCARFVVLVDQRPQYGLKSKSNSILVLDTGNCPARLGLRVLPLAPGGTLTPRDLHWTERGLLIHANRGVLELG